MANPSVTAPSRPPVDLARDELRDGLSAAAKTLADLLNAEDERVRLRAAEAVLDRAGVTKAPKTSIPTAERNVGGAPDSNTLDDFDFSI